MFERRIRKKYLNITGLIHEYLNCIYLNCLSDIADKPWIREGDLETLYPINTKQIQLKNILRIPNAPEGDCSKIIIFIGSKGDGRKFFLKKMLECCYQSLHPHIYWEDNKISSEDFRFPIYVTEEIVIDFSALPGKDSIVDLIKLSFKKQLNLTYTFEKTLTAEAVFDLLKMGKIVFFFEPNIYSKRSETAAALEYINSCEYKPLAILVEDWKLEADKSFNIIRMNELSREQIINYLKQDLPESNSNWEEIIKPDSEILRMLNKPERLLVFTRYIKDFRDGTIPQDVYQIYNAVISSQINSAYNSQDNAGKILSKNQLETWLIKVAKNDSNALNDLYYKLFEHTDMFSGYSFKFEGCKDFLTAKSYASYWGSKKDIETAVSELLKCEHNVSTICFFSRQPTRNANNKFNSLYNVLFDKLLSGEIRDAGISPYILISRVLEINSTYEQQMETYIKYCVDLLGEKTYENEVFEALQILNNVKSQWVSDKLVELFSGVDKEEVPENKKQRIKRRIVVFFGYCKIRLPKAFIDIFNNPETKDKHLKYHITAALNAKDSDNLDKDQIKSMGLHLDDDSILNCDYDRLYKKVLQKKWLSETSLKRYTDDLLVKLKNGEYWERAHAAAALRYQEYSNDGDLMNTIHSILDALENEYIKITNKGIADVNCIRAIKNIIETCCLSSRGSTIKEGFLRILNKYSGAFGVSMTCDVYFTLQKALYLLVIGVQCIQKPESVIRFELGRVFSYSEPLIENYSKYQEIVFDNDENWTRFLENVQVLWDNTREESIEKHFALSDQSTYKRINYSLVRIRNAEKLVANAFVMLFDHDVYCITCRHCFKNIGLDDLRFTLENKRDMTINGTMVYPADFTQDQFDYTDKDDIIIFKIDNFSAYYAKLIITENDFELNKKLNQTDILTSIGFYSSNSDSLETSLLQFRRYENKAFIEMDIKDEHERKYRGMSGMPVFTEEDSKIYGIWKGDDERKNTMRGIIGSEIFDKLNETK